MSGNFARQDRDDFRFRDRDDGWRFGYWNPWWYGGYGSPDWAYWGPYDTYSYDYYPYADVAAPAPQVAATTIPAATVAAAEDYYSQARTAFYGGDYANAARFVAHASIKALRIRRSTNWRR